MLVAKLPDKPAPYRGMAAFGVKDARFFFGRTAYIELIQEQLTYFPFLAVLGSSGSGKTSLVEAGFLARLGDNIFPHSSTWPCPIVHPGPQPLRSLAITLAHLQPQHDVLAAIDALLERLKSTPTDLPEIVRALLPEQCRLVLTIDRLEELFIPYPDERERTEGKEREAFVNALVALVQHPRQPAWVLATMRAGFYGHITRYAALASLVEHHQILLKSMNEEEVAEAIGAPAPQVGAIFEKGLARQVQADAEAQGEVVLPLLQHALDLLWQKRRGRWLTWDAYEEIGGVASALAYHADGVIMALDPQKQQIARRLLTRLIWLEEGTGAPMAGRRTEKTLLVKQFSDPQMAEQVLLKLADERLVVLRGEGKRRQGDERRHRERTTAELIDDTLPLHWNQLRQWVQQDREFLLWRQRLQTALIQYARMKYDKGALLRGALLTEAKIWLKKRTEDLSPDERDFIVASSLNIISRISLAFGAIMINHKLIITKQEYEKKLQEYEKKLQERRHLAEQLDNIDKEIGAMKSEIERLAPLIFIIYAKEDERHVLELYNKLKENNFNPWIDKKDLLPGEDWDRKITQLLDKADFVVICLSNNSSKKRGYIQKEIKMTLESAKKTVPGSIFIIPVRLEECPVPDDIAKYHIFDFFSSNGSINSDGFDNLVKAINKQGWSRPSPSVSTGSPPAAEDRPR